VIRAAVIAAVALAGSGPAHAEPASRRPLPPVAPSPPDERAAAIAADGNFEWPRSGFRASVALGPSGQLGFGLEEASGAGVGFSLRLGTASGPRVAWLVEVANTTYLAEDASGDPQRNTSSMVVLGAQIHATEVLWLRGGAGFANFDQPSEPEARNPPPGWGATVGAGLDLVRRGDWAISAELAFLTALYDRDIVVTGAFLGAGVTRY
jgi:hypothetical protein